MRIVRRILLFLLLGAIVNVAVAWGIFLRVDPRFSEAAELNGTGPEIQDGDYGGWIVFRRELPYAVSIMSRWSDRGLGHGGSGGWPDDPAAPLIPEWAPELSPTNHTPCHSHHYTIAWEFGWPMRSLGGIIDARGQPDGSGWNMKVHTSFAVPLEPKLLEDPNTQWNARAFVYRPLWPGFALNTLFYAFSIWLIFVVPFSIRGWRRSRRMRRGLCPACAYPVGESEVCTECGHALRE